MDTIILILVGAVAGWLASKVMRMETNPLVNILLGVAGSMLGDYVLGLTNFSLGLGLLGDVIVAFVGAISLLLVYKLVSK
jgi:uncharacterized membrane protein YeaQ/YmgE (transglycosylase-associated protein family)